MGLGEGEVRTLREQRKVEEVEEEQGKAHLLTSSSRTAAAIERTKTRTCAKTRPRTRLTSSFRAMERLIDHLTGATTNRRTTTLIPNPTTRTLAQGLSLGLAPAA